MVEPPGDRSGDCQAGGIGLGTGRGLPATRTCGTEGSPGRRGANGPFSGDTWNLAGRPDSRGLLPAAAEELIAIHRTHLDDVKA